mmetsp:Transcript_17070/g.30966  ORF Transcript_17070/g.30966 Transcript_17070/m.30966 type:complete len:637 (+) Transcript_17070:141-2051(+)|eukprot:CAMPEP_0201921632 /NCGR_PEP_ID=MMETSP0903-20130614/9906_1 /ASSEMBLY_ACC=CAM_ASM_000552 /TAXON_ID=420261 /ORGANISM="Thalassiosira antarctica, Strain CCMP982" /LENGTH=636 /DNA_ID=CAMNT_0048458625 /DNA_START=117 /DNA_END=2027 /DNA_ORIENTATION=-
MIDYFKGIYGINLLFRVHGSALYKGSLVGLLSVLIFLAISLQWNNHGRERDLEDDLEHPYGVGVLVSGVTFLIIFRANYGYQRYWEACGALQHFMSKWMDATMSVSVFHLQNKHYDGARPPSFFDHDELNKLNLTRARKRRGEKNNASERRLKSVVDCEKNIYDCEKKRVTESFGRASEAFNVNSIQGNTNGRRPTPPSPHRKNTPNGVTDGYWGIIPPTPDKASSAILQRTTLNSKYFPSSQCPNENFACRPNNKTPPLFLQELAHLSSLACAVALSTLRNDIEGSESVLDIYIPGSPWPVSDPDKLPKHIRREFQHRFHICSIIRHWLGNDRLPHHRSKYNAARPLLILGGVSDSEIQFLQKARGPHAKAQLALGWLTEFLIREHLQGSLGEVHAAVLSSLMRSLSDGMLFYNQARQIMYIPFPFPHAQLSAFFTVLMVVAVPFLMDQYTNVLWIGSLISFLTVTCLVGLHEVARELENPFRNVPNEIPLCTLQAVYNEALVTMFSGYNPDSFWDPDMYQGALEAMALGKVYQKNDVEESAIEQILEMPTLTESTVQLATKESSPEKRKRVSFAAEVETNSDVTKELREVLAKQALEIEELVQLLDKEESNQDSSGIDSLSSSFSEQIDEKKST